MAYAPHFPHMPRRSPLLAFIVLMHAVVIYYINDGLKVSFAKLPEALTMINLAPQSTRVEQVKPLKVEETPTKVAEIEAPVLPPIEIPDEPVVNAVPESITDTETRSAVPDTSAGFDPRHPFGKPPYPPQAIREGQEGLVVVNACVEPDGRLSNVRLARSSGYELLDTAAVRHVARPGMRMRPGIVNGRPVEQCLNVPIRFDLSNR